MDFSNNVLRVSESIYLDTEFITKINSQHNIMSVTMSCYGLIHIHEH